MGVCKRPTYLRDRRAAFSLDSFRPAFKRKRAAAETGKTMGVKATGSSGCSINRTDVLNAQPPILSVLMRARQALPSLSPFRAGEHKSNINEHFKSVRSICFPPINVNDPSERRSHRSREPVTTPRRLGRLLRRKGRVVAIYTAGRQETAVARQRSSIPTNTSLIGLSMAHCLG